MRFFIILLICLSPLTAAAQDSQVVAHIDGDWNGDGFGDRAYVLMFPATNTYDLAVYTGLAGSSDMTLAAHMEGFGDAGGLWDVPVLWNVNSGDAFEVSMTNERGGLATYLKVVWDDMFVVGEFTQEWTGSASCSANYLTGEGVFTLLRTGSESAYSFNIPAARIEDWKFGDDFVPQNCLQY